MRWANNKIIIHLFYSNTMMRTSLSLALYPPGNKQPLFHFMDGDQGKKSFGSIAKTLGWDSEESFLSLLLAY